MKLKKIAALALAGVMAVSMLAGCAGKTTTDKDETEVEVSVGAADVSSQIKLDNEDVKVAGNATYTAWLSKAIEDADFTTTDLLGYVTSYKDTVGSDNSGAVYTYLDKQFVNNEFYYATDNKLTTSAYTALTAEGTKVSAGVYALYGDYTQDEVVTALTKTLDTVTGNLKAATSANSQDTIDHDYTVSVSVQKASSAEANVWFALVTLTETATEREN